PTTASYTLSLHDALPISVELDVDEHPRAGTTIEGLRKLPLAFDPVDGQPGIITAGSSSGITDAGAAVVVASADEAARRGLNPLRSEEHTSELQSRGHLVC